MQEQAVRKRLSELGLWGGRRRWNKAALDEESAGTRLRQALEGFGPLLEAFGQYLSSRIDMLPLSDCLELGKIRCSIPPTASEIIREILKKETSSTGDISPPIDVPPFQQSFIYQWYRTSLSKDRPVTVKVLRPEIEESFHRDQALLATLKNVVMSGQDGKSTNLTIAVEAFNDTLRRQMDLRHEASFLADLAETLEDDDGLETPKLIPHLCSQRVVTMEAPSSRSLSESLAEAESGSQNKNREAELARRLCLAWLRQTLIAGVCIEGPMAENIGVLPEDVFVITGGSFTRIKEETRRNLLDYLTAVAREQPDRACDLLLGETLESVDSDIRDDLRQQFRQGEPFRLGSWSEAYAGRRLADNLFVQWRLAHQADVTPRPELLAFYRGLFDLERIARRFSRRRDPLGEALGDVRIISAAIRLREQLGPSQLRGNVERFLPLVGDLLQKMDELGPLMKQGRLRVNFEAGDGSKGGATRSMSWTFVVGLLFLLVSVTVIGRRLASVQFAGVSLEGLAALGFAGLAAVLLWNFRRDT
jgi:ubiquinone biosynthesis protein